ncbi:MAG: segregation/condensation protein A [Candidatus Pacearchaeota archaeon]
MENEIGLKQERIHSILFNRQVDWQEIIYDLINTEQLDPWDIDIVVLTDKYLEKISKLEKEDFFISGKVLFAAALLLRIKSEILLNRYLKNIDEILFGNKDIKKNIVVESNPIFDIKLDESIPGLTPKSPIPRLRKVTLKELMESLNKAFVTENRRIKKEILSKNLINETIFSLPKKTFSIKNKIKEIYENILRHLKNQEKKKKVSFTELVGEDKEEKIASFGPLLHLENQKKIWLEQYQHFDEIYIWLKDIYFLHNPGGPYLDLKNEILKLNELDKEKKRRLEKVEKDFKDPLEIIKK